MLGIPCLQGLAISHLGALRRLIILAALLGCSLAVALDQSMGSGGSGCLLPYG